MKQLPAILFIAAAVLYGSVSAPAQAAPILDFAVRVGCDFQQPEKGLMDLHVLQGSTPLVLAMPTPEQPPEQTTDDEVDFSKLQWTRGGENFAGAVRDSRVTIRNVAVLEDALVALLGNPAAGQVTGQVAGQVEKK